jgi:hypothetical protein
MENPAHFRVEIYTIASRLTKTDYLSHNDLGKTLT